MSGRRRGSMCTSLGMLAGIHLVIWERARRTVRIFPGRAGNNDTWKKTLDFRPVWADVGQDTLNGDLGLPGNEVFQVAGAEGRLPRLSEPQKGDRSGCEAFHQHLDDDE